MRKNISSNNSDEIVRQQCRAREDAERHERTLLRDIRLLKEEVSQKDAQIEADKAQIAEQEARIAELEALLKQKKRCGGEKQEI